MHTSGEEFDRPSCHENTRVAVLKRLMDWIVGNVDPEQAHIWLYGDAGAGKSTIAQTLAEMCAQKKILLGSFFFSRTDPRRSTYLALAATIAYHAATVSSELRTNISTVIEEDPLTFEKSLRI